MISIAGAVAALKSYRNLAIAVVAALLVAGAIFAVNRVLDSYFDKGYDAAAGVYKQKIADLMQEHESRLAFVEAFSKTDAKTAEERLEQLNEKLEQIAKQGPRVTYVTQSGKPVVCTEPSTPDKPAEVMLSSDFSIKWNQMNAEAKVVLK